jgi:hypothetical protein
MGQKAPTANREGQSSELVNKVDTRQDMREQPHDDTEGDGTPTRAN